MTRPLPPAAPPAPLAETLPPDRIHLRDHVVTVEIGAFQTERGAPQRLRFAVEAALTAPVVGADDRVDRILSYDVLTGAVADALADQRYNLLETLAEAIAAQVLAHPRVARVAVTVEKLDRVPGALGISITRAAPRIAATPPVGPAATVLWIADAAALPADGLPPGPLVALPAAPGLPVPTGGNARMVALLALDQAAWALAARLGVTVADSRTEIDWALAEGAPVLWAPTRMVADIPDLPADPAALATWLAGRLGAGRRAACVAPDRPARPGWDRWPG